MATGRSKDNAAEQSSSPLRDMLRYRPLRRRASLPLSQRAARKRITSWAAAHRDASLDEMIRFALDFTSDALTFVFDKAERTPDGVLRRARANCVGYAALFNAVLTELFRQRGLSSRYRTEHWVAKISFAGKSLHTLLESPFFRDHDYNRVRDLKTGRTLSVDPSLYEYAGIVYVHGG
jgi:hypothetical protein